MTPGDPITVLHYLGYDSDRGGIPSVVRALAQTARFRCVLGVNPGFVQRREPRLDTMEFPPVRAEMIRLSTVWQTLAVARRMQTWLRADRSRVVHAHSRAGLLVAVWLHWLGETRFVASVHVFGRRRWLYRRLRHVLGERLVWLSPAMKSYYGVGAETWAGCLPDCVSDGAMRPVQARSIRQTTIFGCVGSLTPVKQWELVIRAVAQVAPETLMRVIHVGWEGDSSASASYARRLRRLSDALGVADRFEWRGETSDVDAFHDEIDCLIVPSAREAMSVAALEAIAAGIPVLASSASGTRDLIAECSGGWTFPAGSAVGLAKRLTMLATGPGLTEWRRNDSGLSRFLASRAVEAHAAKYQWLLGD